LHDPLRRCAGDLWISRRSIVVKRHVVSGGGVLDIEIDSRSRENCHAAHDTIAIPDGWKWNVSRPLVWLSPHPPLPPCPWLPHNRHSVDQLHELFGADLRQ